MFLPGVVPRVKAKEGGEPKGGSLAKGSVEEGLEAEDFKETRRVAELVTYTGLGVAPARLLSIASSTLLYTPLPLLSPEEVAVHRVAYVMEEGKAVIYSLGDPNDLIRVAEALWLTGYEVEVIRNEVEAWGPLQRKLERIGGKILKGELEDVLLEMMLDAIKRVLEVARGARASRVRWEIETLNEAEDEVRKWFKPVKERVSGAEAIVYTPSMEGPALLLSRRLSLPAFALQQADILNALVLTTSAEEIWARGYVGRCLKGGKRAKIVSYPTDPLTAPIYFLLGLKLEGLDISA